MKRWMFVIVAAVCAFALVATPALAADQLRSQDRMQDQMQDGTCGDRAAECVQAQTCTGDQTQSQDCEAAQSQVCDQTQAQDCEAAQSQVCDQTQVQTQVEAQVQAQTATATRVQAQVRTQAQTMVQPDQDEPHVREWVRKFERLHKQYAKRVHVIASND